MTKNKNLVAISSENQQLKSCKGLSMPSILGNSKYNQILEWIHEVLENLVRTYNISKTYVGKDDPWLGILTKAAF